jgi:hypothetical protein
MGFIPDEFLIYDSKSEMSDFLKTPSIPSGFQPDITYLKYGRENIL